MSVFNKIQAGFALGATNPITAGIEDFIYVFNKGDIKITYDPNNPLNVIGISSINGAKMYKFYGTNNSFGSASKLVKTSAGPRYTEEVDFNALGISTSLKNTLQQMGYGRCQCITVRNFKDGDSVFELFGAQNGLILIDAENTSNDETYEGGYKLKLGNPDKIREPYFPRALNISAFGPSLPGTVPVVGTATAATAVPTGVTVVGSTTGGSIPAQTTYYKVVSVDAQGTTLGSSEVSVVNTGTTSSNTVSWTGAQGATSYRVYRGTSSNGENVYFVSNTTSFVDTGAAGTSGTVPASNTAIKATATPTGVSATGSATGGVKPAGTYYYIVTAVDALGETIGSAEQSVTLSGSTSQVTIAWSAAQGASSYKVYMGTSASGENVYFQTTALNLIDTGATVPATYASTLAALEALC